MLRQPRKHEIVNLKVSVYKEKDMLGKMIGKNCIKSRGSSQDFAGCCGRFMESGIYAYLGVTLSMTLPVTLSIALSMGLPVGLSMGLPAAAIFLIPGGVLPRPFLVMLRGVPL